MKQSRHQKGFTLIEAALSLAIMGVIFGGALLSVNHMVRAHKIETTKAKIELINNALASYVQQNYRLPCPGDPNAAPSDLGKERNGGKCLDNSTAEAMYQQAEGIVPWKTLGIPESMVVDAWKRYITYRPAPHLTVDVMASEQQGDPLVTNAIEIHNACRGPLWYDKGGNHINRAKALFCCNAAPKSAYLLGPAGKSSSNLPNNWRKTGIAATSVVASTSASTLPDTAHVFMTTNWQDYERASGTTMHGDFQNAYHKSGPDAPLLRATGYAVALISHGSNGSMAYQARSATRYGGLPPGTVEQRMLNMPQMFAAAIGHPKVSDGSYDPMGNRAGAADDIVSWIRTDQLMAKIGTGSCQYPPNAAFTPYACKPIDFTDEGLTGITDPTSGSPIDVPYVYGIQMALTGQHYTLRSNFTRRSEEAGYRNSLGMYTVSANGDIQTARMIMTDTKLVDEDQAVNTDIGLSSNDLGTGQLGIGIFIMPDGFNTNNGYRNIDWERDEIRFYANYGTPQQRIANIADTAPPTMVIVNHETGQERVIRGAGNASAYHMYSNINDQKANRLMTEDRVRQGDTSISWVGLPRNPDGSIADTTVMQVGFEDLQTINCFYRQGDNACIRNLPEDQRISDGRGGYLASIGDNDYDDVTFTVKMSACPQGGP